MGTAIVLLGALCGGSIVLAAGYAVFSAWLKHRWRTNIENTEENGTKTVGWIVQANSSLYEAGSESDYNAAFVLLSPDSDTAEDDVFMPLMVEQLESLKHKKRLRSDDEEFVADFLKAEMFFTPRRIKVPKSLSEGRRLYISHIKIMIRHLPTKKLDLPFVMCLVVWDDRAAWVISSPYPKSIQKQLRVAAEDELNEE